MNQSATANNLFVGCSGAAYDQFLLLVLPWVTGCGCLGYVLSVSLWGGGYYRICALGSEYAQLLTNHHSRLWH